MTCHAGYREWNRTTHDVDDRAINMVAHVIKSNHHDDRYTPKAFAVLCDLDGIAFVGAQILDLVPEVGHAIDQQSVEVMLPEDLPHREKVIAILVGAYRILELFDEGESI